MRRVLTWLFALEATLCVVFAIARPSLAGVFSGAFAVPFEQIGLGLRALSLSGTVGNIGAFVIYIALSLSPAISLLVLRKKRGLFAEDALLGLLSILMFVVMYFMINPDFIARITHGAEGIPVGKAMLGGVVYAVLEGYFVLRVLRLFSKGGTAKLTSYMAFMMGLLGAVFVLLAFGVEFSGMVNAMHSLRAGNVGNGSALGMSSFFALLRFVVNALPYVLNVAVIFAALRLLEEFRADRYSRESTEAAARMSRLCVRSLSVTVLLGIVFNLLQLLFAASLTVVNVSVQIPVFSIAFVLAALLLTRFVAENKQLKDDNDMFI